MSGALTTPVETRQLLRFAVVGCLNVTVSFATFLVFYRYVPLASVVLDVLGTPGARIADAMSRAGVPTADAGFANAIGYAAGMVNSFVLNKRWTFEAKGRTALQARRFVILNLAGLSISTMLVLVLVDVLGVPYLPVWIATTALVMIANFVGNKYWIFVANPDDDRHADAASANARM